MLEMNVLRTQWIMMSLTGGLVVMLLVIMTYLAIWRPRRDPKKPKELPGPAWIQWFGEIPWVLIFSIVAGALFMHLYIVGRAVYPIRW